MFHASIDSVQLGSKSILNKRGPKTLSLKMNYFNKITVKINSGLKKKLNTKIFLQNNN